MRLATQLAVLWALDDVDQVRRPQTLTMPRGKAARSVAPVRVPLYETHSSLNALVWLTRGWFGRGLLWLT